MVSFVLRDTVRKTANHPQHFLLSTSFIGIVLLLLPPSRKGRSARGPSGNLKGDTRRKAKDTRRDEMCNGDDQSCQQTGSSADAGSVERCEHAE